jgi:hypothetical protein
MVLKLLVLAAIIGAVFFGYRFIDRRIKASGPPQARGDTRRVDNSQPMARCSVCETYVPAEGATRCERAECPYPA